MSSPSRRNELLISAAELQSALERPHPPKVLDVRWSLAEPDGAPAFARGHIPGAQYVALDDVFARLGEPADGRHPLPHADNLGSALARLGISAIDEIVVLDDSGSWAACRASWVLRDAGLPRVRVLDGGLAAWKSAGYPLESGQQPASRVAVPALESGLLQPLSMADAAEWGASGRLIDARAPERYRGDVEPLDPIAGHIPGAINLPVGSVFNPDGTFRPESELHELFAAAGIRSGSPVGVYCGSGVSATPLALALEMCGFDSRLYPGSWSQWSNTPGQPVATGSTP